MKPPLIQYLRQHEIDKAAWDTCISEADNGLIYGYSFYLDAMTTHWDALVLNDYKTVMPLPWRKKGGLSYLYQPYAVAQLGVFGKNISPDLIEAFLRAVPKTFRYWDYTLNHHNQFYVEGFPFKIRMNYVLPLNTTYEALYKGYRENIRRNIKKSAGYGNKVVTNVGIDDIIALTHFQPKPIPENDIRA
ncbi:MAG TPA: hypothetical protein VFL47_05445, partial [Flavisolibacter sp.]|nr:hypothetical protein [Flavisolibacter sp.]